MAVTINNVKVCYLSSGYPSHSRVAADYRAIFNSAVTLVSQPSLADVVIIHDEPHKYKLYASEHPCLGTKYVVGYSVWEASRLPRSFAEQIGAVQEVWTSSEYCRSVFSQAHPRVSVLPHVVQRDLHCNEEQPPVLAKYFTYNPSYLYILSIGRLWDYRKNIEALTAAFEQTWSDLPHVRLIIKTSPGDHLSSRDPRICSIPEWLSDRDMNWLHKYTHIYASAHHSEGWGLCLSDAMLFGAVVIASRYSGNLEFMNDANSILVNCLESEIDRSLLYNRYEETMLWGYPCIDDFTQALKAASLTYYDSHMLRLRCEAKRVGTTFSMSEVKARMIQLLKAFPL